MKRIQDAKIEARIYKDYINQTTYEWYLKVYGDIGCIIKPDKVFKTYVGCKKNCIRFMELNKIKNYKFIG